MTRFWMKHRDLHRRAGDLELASALAFDPRGPLPDRELTAAEREAVLAAGGCEIDLTEVPRDRAKLILCKDCGPVDVRTMPLDDGDGDYYEWARDILENEGYYVVWPVPYIEYRHASHVPVTVLCPPCVAKRMAEGRPIQ